MKLILKTVVFLILVASCSNHRVESIIIRGSDTEVNLVLRLAETYMENDPNVSIAVTGGGSGTGIAALINKKTDIANSSRAFKKAELNLAKERQVNVIPIVFAIDALTFIVHESLNINSISLEQIRAIYTGMIDNWASIGGPDLSISLYGRQANSGTFSFIQQEILKGDYSAKMKQMNGTSQIIESIKNDPAGIGYVGIGYIVDKTGKVVNQIKVLNIYIADQTDSVSPLNKMNITNGKYPIVRPLYQYLDGLPKGKLKDFILYELSANGQKIIVENGYFPITEDHRINNLRFLNHD